METKSHRTPSGNIVYLISRSEDETAPWIVMLPGLTADHRLFAPQIESLADEFNIIAWDAPRHGASRPFSGPFRLDDAAMWLHEIIQKETASASPNPEHPHAGRKSAVEQPRVILVGQSLGAYIAQVYIELFPDRISGLVSIDSAPLKRVYYKSWEIAALKHTYWMYRAFPFKLLAESGARGCAETEVGRAYMKSLILSYEKKEYCALADEGYRALASAVEADRAYDIGCPVLVLCGEKDKAGSTKRYSRQWAEREGLPVIWIPRAGHNSTLDAPAFVAKAIGDFARSGLKTSDSTRPQAPLPSDNGTSCR